MGLIWAYYLMSSKLAILFGRCCGQTIFLTFVCQGCHLTLKLEYPEKIETWSGGSLTGAARQAYVLGVGATVYTHPPPFYARISVIHEFFKKIFTFWQHSLVMAVI